MATKSRLGSKAAAETTAQKTAAALATPTIQPRYYADEIQEIKILDD